MWEYELFLDVYELEKFAAYSFLFVLFKTSSHLLSWMQRSGFRQRPECSPPHISRALAPSLGSSLFSTSMSHKFSPLGLPRFLFISSLLHKTAGSDWVSSPWDVWPRNFSQEIISWHYSAHLVCCPSVRAHIPDWLLFSAWKPLVHFFSGFLLLKAAGSTWFLLFHLDWHLGFEKISLAAVFENRLQGRKGRSRETN